MKCPTFHTCIQSCTCAMSILWFHLDNFCSAKNTGPLRTKRSPKPKGLFHHKYHNHHYMYMYHLFDLDCPRIADKNSNIIRNGDHRLADRSDKNTRLSISIITSISLIHSARMNIGDEDTESLADTSHPRLAAEIVIELLAAFFCRFFCMCSFLLQ